MSLLLLFQGAGAAATGDFCNIWTVVTAGSNTFTVVPTAWKDTWNDWATYQWNAIYDSPATSNQTWAYMGGDVFTVATTPSTPWVVLSLTCVGGTGGSNFLLSDTGATLVTDTGGELIAG